LILINNIFYSKVEKTFKMSNKVHWVTAGGSLTVNGTNFYGHIVSEAYSTLNLNCNVYGDMYVKGNVNVGGNITGNLNCGG
jgi:cytoskeletal protein CcmA (bactofilin family)